jgi:hypothetical protein
MSIIAPGFASASSTESKGAISFVPPSKECVALMTKLRGGEKYNPLTSKDADKLVKAGCLSKNPFFTSNKQSENWNTGVCQAHLSPANTMIKEITTENNIITPQAEKILTNLWQPFNKKWGKTINKLERQDGKLSDQLYQLYKKKSWKAKTESQLRKQIKKVNYRLNKINNILDNKLKKNSQLAALNKQLVKNYYAIEMLSVTLYSEGCLSDPGLENFSKTWAIKGYFVSNKENFNEQQRMYFSERNNKQAQQIVRKIGKVHNILRLSLSQSDNKKFVFGTRQVARIVSNSLGQEWRVKNIRFGSGKQVKANKKLYIKSLPKKKQVLISVSYFNLNGEKEFQVFKLENISFYGG